MAHIDWQSPPYSGRTLWRSLPPDARYQVQANPQLPGLHEGSVTFRTGRRSAVAAGIYWSRYGFQIAPDGPGDAGPWDLLLTLVVAGVVQADALGPGGCAGVMAARARVRRLSDGAVVLRGSVRGTAAGRIIRGNPLHAIHLDVELVPASEYTLDLWSYASLSITRPAMAYPLTTGANLGFDGVGAGAMAQLIVH